MRAPPTTHCFIPPMTGFVVSGEPHETLYACFETSLPLETPMSRKRQDFPFIDKLKEFCANERRPIDADDPIDAEGEASLPCHPNDHGFPNSRVDSKIDSYGEYGGTPVSVVDRHTPNREHHKHTRDVNAPLQK